MLDRVGFISPPCDNYCSPLVLVSDDRPLAVSSSFWHDDLIECMEGDGIVNIDELLEEALSLSVEEKINLLNLLKSLSLSAVEQE